MIFFSNFSSIYVGSEVAEAPLIVWPHGGPHSAIPWAFSTDIYYFLDQGFSCLLINYRGSISQGISSSNYLSFFHLFIYQNSEYKIIIILFHKANQELCPYQAVLEIKT